VLVDCPFDPRFFERHRLFWPIAPAAAAFASEADWPEVATYERAFARSVDAPVRFEPAPAAPRRNRGPVDRDNLYDARIVRDRCVPTRRRSWHDFLNALVWATFPRAKRALHERQHRVLQERIPAGARTLPATRSREHDALALIDEGGVVILEDEREREMVVFGHAVYEGLVLGRGPTTTCAIHARVQVVPGASQLVPVADTVLADHVTRSPLDPSTMDRVRIQ
jgi:hypothetical protein